MIVNVTDSLLAPTNYKEQIHINECCLVFFKALCCVNDGYF